MPGWKFVRREVNERTCALWTSANTADEARAESPVLEVVAFVSFSPEKFAHHDDHDRIKALEVIGALAEHGRRQRGSIGEALEVILSDVFALGRKVQRETERTLKTSAT